MASDKKITIVTTQELTIEQAQSRIASLRMMIANLDTQRNQLSAKMADYEAEIFDLETKILAAQ